MTKQEYYDLLVRSAYDGTFPSAQGTQCLYRGPGGKKCAVGLLIPDEKYDPAMECGTLLCRPEVLAAIGEPPNGLTWNDLRDVQWQHDDLAYGNWNADVFVNRLNKLSCFADVRQHTQSDPPAAAPVSVCMEQGYTIKDSGERQSFTTGAVRDTETGKPRFGLIPVGPLTRVAHHYTKGAAKYGDHNWQKGMPLSRVYESLLRHVYAWRAGEPTEDHLAAVVFNAMALMHYQDSITAGTLPAELDDLKGGAA